MLKNIKGSSEFKKKHWERLIEHHWRFTETHCKEHWKLKQKHKNPSTNQWSALEKHWKSNVPACFRSSKSHDNWSHCHPKSLKNVLGTMIIPTSLKFGFCNTSNTKSFFFMPRTYSFKTKTRTNMIPRK